MTRTSRLRGQWKTSGIKVEGTDSEKFKKGWGIQGKGGGQETILSKLRIYEKSLEGKQDGSSDVGTSPAKPDDPGLNSGIHMVEGESSFHRLFSKLH